MELERLSKQRLLTDKFLSSMTKLYQSIDSFLLDPGTDSGLETIKQHLKEASTYSNKLHENDHHEKEDTLLQKIKMADNLSHLSSHITELLSLRTDINRQYPGLSLSANVMAIPQDTIRTQLDILLHEVETDNTIKNPDIYPKLLKTQLLVEKLISQFRIYLANRLASFTTDILTSQAESISQIHLSLHTNLKELEDLYANEKDSFAAPLAINTALENELQWYKLFLNARGLMESDNWRQDTFHKKTFVIPLFKSLTKSLVEYKQHLTDEADEITVFFKQNNQTLFIALTTVIIITLLYILVLLFVIDLIVFKPIMHVAHAMKMRAFGHAYPEVGNIVSRETKNLLDAFNEMSLQINKRQSELEHQTLHDSLTSLPNRGMLDERLKYHIASSKRNKGMFSLLLLDLNHFKQVNDSLGHHIGDLLLIKVSERISQCIRETDTLARLGGDEFAILMPDTSKADSTSLASKLSELISNTFTINEHTIHISTSIGIVGYPEDAPDNTTLMQLADIAMYNSKQNKTIFTLYHSAMNYQITNRVAIVDDLHDAISQNDLELHYQPQINLHDGEITSCEALLRWKHRTHGYIPSEEIIQLAEQFGLMNKLTYWIIEQSIKQCRKWHTTGYDIRVSVNLSAQNLNDNNLLYRISELLQQYNLDSRYVTLEITENSMMANPGRAIETLNQLSSIGLLLSIDDFGTGFSSLSYLKNLPVHEVKIDKSFVFDMENNRSDQTIVQSTIDLGHNLGLLVIAEGIESISTSNQLKTMGCDYGQGHWILKPVNSDDIMKWFSEFTNNDSSEKNNKLNKLFFPLHQVSQ